MKADIKHHESRLNNLHKQADLVNKALTVSEAKANDVDTKSSLIAKLRRNWVEEDVRMKFEKRKTRISQSKKML